MEGRSASPGRSFVGRARELDELRTELAEAACARGGLILVSGEPGIGKTRLAEELADHAHAAGTLVVWGRCWEGEGAPAFWPWVQVIRSLSESVTAAELAAHLGAGGPYVAGVVPELAAKLPRVPQALTSPESESARFYLFDAVTTFLKNVSRARPLLVVLDDLHWADRSSILLLEFVAKELRETRILAIGTYREGEVRANLSVTVIVGGLLRAGRSLPLRGLSEADVALLMERRGARRPDARLVAAVHESTAGNPFFVDETVRLLAAEGITEARPGERLPIPEGVRATIRRRVKSLPEACGEILSLAAVIGRKFELGTLASASGHPKDDLLDLLESAVRSKLVTRVEGALTGYRFAHALVRETIYENLDRTAQVRLHRGVGEALEEMYRANPEPYLTELAHHFSEAAAGGTAVKAVDYARRAGKKALAMLAFEEAARLFEGALSVLDLEEPADGTERCRLLLHLADARRKSGDQKATMEICLRVAEAARKLGDLELLASAAALFGIASHETGREADAVTIMEEALAGLKKEDSSLRAHLLGHLAVALTIRDLWVGPIERREALVREAVEMTRRIGEPQALADAQWSRLEALEDPENAEDRVAAATELVEAAGLAGHRGLVFAGHYHRLWNLLALGNMRAVDSELAVCARLAEEMHEPFVVAHTIMSRAMRALHDGLLDESERLALEALAIAWQMRSQLIEVQMHALITHIRTEQGRLAELEATIRQILERNPRAAGVRETFAFLLVELGRTTEARVELERLDANEFAGLPRADRGFFTVAARLTDVAASLGDAGLAARLYERLLPYARINLTFAAAVSLGSASRLLGALAATLSRPDDAARHFEDALRANARMGAIPWLAHTRFEYARMLLARGAAADRERALALLAEAVATAEALGMKRLLERARGLAAGPGTPAEVRSEPDRPGGGAEPSRFYRDGGHWTISHLGVVFRLKDSKGLRTIAHLLRHPGVECHVAELVALAEGGNGDEPPRTDAAELASQDLSHGGLGDAGELLDARAKGAYRARLEDLRDELEGALRNNDTGRAAKARQEIDFLSEELSRAVGLRGRDRKAAAATERARLNVTRAVRGAVDKIADFSPPLHEHLSGAIRTGMYCSYQPGSRDSVSWAFDPQ